MVTFVFMSLQYIL